MTGSNTYFDMRLTVPLLVAHRLYLLFQSNPGEHLIVLAADALNKTKPSMEIKNRFDSREPGTPDTLVLLNNLDCLSPLAPSEWPKRLMNKAKWGVFAQIMRGLELYLSEVSHTEQMPLKGAAKNDVRALFEFIAESGLKSDLPAGLQKAVQLEQERMVSHTIPLS